MRQTLRTEAEQSMTSKEAQTGQKASPSTQRWHTSLRVAGTITTVPTSRSASDSDTMNRLDTVRSFLSLHTARNTSTLPTRVSRVSRPRVTPVATPPALRVVWPGAPGTRGALVILTSSSHWAAQLTPATPTMRGRGRWGGGRFRSRRGFGVLLRGEDWLLKWRGGRRGYVSGNRTISSQSELRSCVKVEMAVLCSPILTVLTVSVDVKQH